MCLYTAYHSIFTLQGVAPTGLRAQRSRVEFSLGTQGLRPETGPALS